MPLTSTLQEFGLAAHFRDGLDLTVRDLAAWSDIFAADFPEFRQLPQAPRVELGSGLEATVQIIDGGSELPRVLMRAPQTGLYVLLQSDRFTCGWSRVEPLGELAEYPGFDAMKHHCRELTGRVLRWYGERFGGAPLIRLMELAYFNAVPNDERSGRRRRLYEVLRFLKEDMRPLNAFQVQWGEVLQPGSPSAAQVRAQAGLGMIQPDRPVFIFNFSGLTPWEGTLGDDDALSAVDEIHQRILDIRLASITSEFIG